MWMLREDCLDEAIIKLTNLLTCKDMCAASNAALVLARSVALLVTIITIIIIIIIIIIR